MQRTTTIKLHIWLFFTFFAPFVLGSTLAYVYERGERREELARNLHKTAQTFSECMAKPMAYFSPQEGLRVGQMIALGEDVVEVFAYADIYQLPVVHIDMPERRKGELLSCERPVVFEGKTIGKIRIVVTTALVIKEMLSPFLKKILIIFLAMSFIGFLMMGLAFRRYLLLPMDRLMEQAHMITSGAMDKPFVWQGNDEFAVLGKIIEEMRKKLFLRFSKVHLEARTDELTGISNRRDFLERARKVLLQCGQKGQPFSLIMFDLDDFKQINDTYGHAVGDEVLNTVSVVMSKNLRAGDLFARWGGEEFLLALCGTSKDQAGQLAEKLREVVAKASYPKNIALTASFGVVQAQEEESFETLLDIVDAAMYLAKKRGKNRVVIHE